MIGERLKQARDAAGLNQRDLAQAAGVSAMAISKYERNESTPSSGVLLALARALNVRVEYFFRQVDAQLESVNYREHELLPDLEKTKVLADAREQIERWIGLEAFLPTPWSIPFELPADMPKRIDRYDDIEDAAIALRKSWELGLNPVPDLIDTFESHGIKVFVTKYDGHAKFNGLAAQVNGAPVIVIGKHEHWPGDRQRFTLAHELGHLVLEGRLARKLDAEKACNRFAGAFLVPKPMVVAALGKRRSWLEPQELMLLKHEWGLSMLGWTCRARDAGVLPHVRFQSLGKLFREHGWDTKEPDPQYPHERTRLFKQLVYRALAEDIIGESKAAELLGMSQMELHACRKLECAGDAVDQ
jgi:Zn-dependent peptidase ImmA (M78 family)/DNA-binding XRE family transcriptional regulator